MEQDQGRQKASKYASSDDDNDDNDVISSMPDNVITNILDCLSVPDAVGTSILSRNWRYKWTLLTQFVLDRSFSVFLFGTQGETGYDWRDVSRLLLHLKGPITKFYLYIPNYKGLDQEDIDHWVLFLSTKGLKEFTLINMDETPLRLSTNLFRCLELKRLKLRNCCFHLAHSFRGFKNLLSLDLYLVTIEGANWGKLIIKCPSLEIFKISYHDPAGEVKLVNFARLKNLKVLYLPLRKVENITFTSSSIFELGGYLPKLQELYLDYRSYMFLGDAVGKKVICNAFPCLETLTLYPIDFNDGFMLSYACIMLYEAPNLQTLKITATYNAVPPPAFLNVDNYARLPLQLRNVVLSSFRGTENEVCLIKYLLVCSPLLKKMSVGLDSSSMVGGADGKFMFANKLLKLHRASTIAEIDLY